MKSKKRKNYNQSMKGKNEFTTSERTKIINLIEKKVTAPKNQQNNIRNQIRRIGFYYTDFETSRINGGYTVADFEKLEDEKKITIKDDQKK